RVWCCCSARGMTTTATSRPLVCLGDDWSASSPWPPRQLRPSITPFGRCIVLGDHVQQGRAPVAAGGASNAEIAGQLFVSRKTVEYHLHKAFTKLGIAGRLELVKLDLS
ncbi:MAG TPA: helix-turn-helix transcriptional regulator, partial [Propionibacteriaceae bacterium]|nr:helix-turn-helix transcriptional regulator [Propionibacteriaceae bacterium]